MTHRHHPRPRVLVVGAGFAGAIMAERIASTLGLRVLVIDRRCHLAGNAYDERDASGTLVHRYGPHLFHANSEKVVDYLSRFTDWWPYEHRVLASVRGQLLPVPINLDTVNRLYGLRLDEQGLVTWLAKQAEPIARPRNAEEAVVARMGRDIYETFFRGYTRKQWGVDPTELDASVTARIPVRSGRDDRYFTDRFQALPADGYSAMFTRMLDHPLIELRLATEYLDVRDAEPFAHTVFTGPIDEFFDRRFGPLPYRSLRFRFETVPTAAGKHAQPVGQVNYPDEAVRHTRITEFRHFGPLTKATSSTIAYEFPSATGDPFYPVPAPENRERYHRYEKLAARCADVTFVGRLARYQYLNMDQVVGQALQTFAERATAIGASVAPAIPAAA